MKRQKLFSKSIRISILAITLAALFGVSTYTPLAATSWKVASVDLPGATGMNNNVALAYDRYVLIAPYAPSKPVEDNNDLSQLDNCFLYLIDTKKPTEGAQKVKLTANDVADAQGKIVYYPSRVLFDADSSTVFVRGTRYEEKDGLLEEIEVLAYLRLNLDDNGKPVFGSNVVTIDIKGVGSDHCSDAPMDFALSQKGSLLLFTNGASIFSYNLGQGYVYKVDIVPEKDFNADSKISYLDIDKVTNTLVVCWNKKEQGEGDAVKVSSQLSFYGIDKDGTLPFLTRAYESGFAEGTALTAGSNVAVTSTFSKTQPDQLIPDNAYFVTNDGSLCQIDIEEQSKSANVKQLRKIDELAQSGSGEGSPRIIKFDAAKRVIGIVKQGFTAQIRRPSNGRPGRPSIVRALNVSKAVEQPAFALVKLGKKNKIVSSDLFIDDFNNEVGLSNFVYGNDSQWLVSTHSGKLYSVGLSDAATDNRVELLGEIGSRINYIDYFAGRDSVVAISSFELDEEGSRITSPGSLVVARMGATVGQTLGAMVLRTLSSSGSILASATPSIRRPCNIKR
jgi:hypothetical protein